MGPLSVAVSPGELIDKLTILQIKSERIAAPEQLENIERQRGRLRAVETEGIPPDDGLDVLRGQLLSINEALWDLENAIREHEAGQDFGPKFVEAARSIYRSNDRRASIKKQIDELFGSEIAEEKSYT